MDKPPGPPDGSPCRPAATTTTRTNGMRVLVTGAYGFIGAHIVAALREAGHAPVGAVRRPDSAGRFSDLEAISCDMASDTRVEDWLPRLAGIEAVVNAAGILRERGASCFDAVHRAAPSALFEACVKGDVSRVIQISAIGAPEHTGFVRSKHEADAHLKTLDLDWIILRPSVVYGTAGSYGGTSLLRAMAALPGVLLVPGGAQYLQPIAIEDLARAVVQLLETGKGDRKILEAVGPQPLTLEEYLRAWRRWLGFGTPRVIRTPLALSRAAAWLGERLARGPLGETMFRMLQHGNVGARDAYATFAEAIDFRPRALPEVLAAAPSHVQDRWHARLYFLRPLLRVTLASLWLLSGLAGFVVPLDQSQAVLARAGIAPTHAAPLIYGASVFDIALGMALALRFRPVSIGALMLLSLLAYTIFLGAALPHLWLDPFGGLIKNIALIPALLVMMSLEQAR